MPTSVAPARGSDPAVGPKTVGGEKIRVDQPGAPTESHESESPEPESHEENKYIINWAAAIWLVAIHVIALAAPFTFTWAGLFLAVGLHWLTGSIGICLGFHRLLTHTGMDTPRWLRNSLALIGSMAGEGGPLSWCANHRKHHAFSDQEGDPHSPHDGPWWAHMFWLAYRTDNGDEKTYWKKWVPDLLKEPFLAFCERWFLPLHIVAGAALTGIGYLIGGTPLALSFLVWGVAIRMVFVLHVTWLVNSASHIWGYKNYETRDDSRNLWWVAVLAYGEGWHNNHHAHPRLAQHGHKWWEFDITYQAIRLLQVFGLAKNVQDYASFKEKQKLRAERRDEKDSQSTDQAA
jgi:stearoyl-CoA desaturase (delta-9 desaturase)